MCQCFHRVYLSEGERKRKRLCDNIRGGPSQCKKYSGRDQTETQTHFIPLIDSWTLYANATAWIIICFIHTFALACHMNDLSALVPDDPLVFENNSNWNIVVQLLNWKNGCFTSTVPGGLILQTSLLWVTELIPKICPARTSPFIWVGILCQLSMASSLWDSPPLRKTNLTGKLAHYHHSHQICLFFSI